MQSALCDFLRHVSHTRFEHSGVVESLFTTLQREVIRAERGSWNRAESLEPETLDDIPAFGYEARLRQQAPPGTHFLGFVEDQETLFGIAARARLFVFPSRCEAMSMMLLEVASLGVPALVSDIPENRAVLTEEHVTFFRAGDAGDLRERMQQCLEDAEGIRVKAQACQAHVGETYAWPRIASAYERMYARAVGEPVTAGQSP